jgi:hypothetical protein
MSSATGTCIYYVGYLAAMKGEEVCEMHKKFWSEYLDVGEHSEDISVNGRIILEWISEKLGGKVWTGLI